MRQKYPRLGKNTHQPTRTTLPTLTLVKSVMSHFFSTLVAGQHPTHHLFWLFLLKYFMNTSFGLDGLIIKFLNVAAGHTSHNFLVFLLCYSIDLLCYLGLNLVWHPNPALTTLLCSNSFMQMVTRFPFCLVCPRGSEQSEWASLWRERAKRVHWSGVLPRVAERVSRGR